MRPHLLLATILSIASHAAAQGEVQIEPAVPTQLPDAVRPSHYDVTLRPNLAKLRFEASANLTIDVLKPTASITLNATDLAFRQATLRNLRGASRLKIRKISVLPAEQTATFTLEKKLDPGRYVLSLNYHGPIGTQPGGLFALDYDSAKGRKRALYTQFENSDARRVIPSWDEPAYKASFTLRAIIPQNLLAISNMPTTRKSPLKEHDVLVSFGTTPKISTYLLFFALGDFERKTTLVDGTEIGMVIKKGDLHKADYALDSAKKLLPAYNEYFGTPYTLPKLDNIAAPGRSLFFGAMENWGAIFTFEHALLLDPSISTERDKQGVFTTLAHEMAHQWFGNLVTMQWWDNLWLNEGFASWMAGRITQELHPEWNVSLHGMDARDWAMVRDSVSSTHPVQQQIQTVQQASEAFDIITYQKGEAVIRMLEDYVGPAAWREGIRSYIKKYSYANTTSDNLWEQLELAAGKPIQAIARDFILQPGVPLIRVQDVKCDDQHTTLTLQQGEFSRDHPSKTPIHWHVPVTVQLVGQNTREKILVSNGNATLRLAGCGAVLANAGQNGYYRTSYQADNIAAIARVFATLSPADQMGVLTDTWALGLAGTQPLSDFFSIADKLPLSADPQIWEKFVNFLDETSSYYQDDPERQRQFHQFAISRLRPMMAHLGWNALPDESSAASNLRERLIAALSNFGDQTVISEAKRLYQAQLNGLSSVPVELRKVIMSVVAQHADATTWNVLYGQAKAEKNQIIKDQLYDLLASTKDETLARQALVLALSGEAGASNASGMISRVAGEHPDLAFDFSLQNLEKVAEYLPNGMHHRFLLTLAGRSSMPAMIDKLKIFAKDNLAADRHADVDTAIADISYRTKIKALRLPSIDQWLLKHSLNAS